jgi:pSer/pThr/pTyr-binding forkhead associated (FHA) protein
MPWFSKRSASDPSDDAPTRRSGPRLALFVVEGADPGTELRLAHFDVEIGRGDETRIRGDRLLLRDRSVSTRQAKLLAGADGWTLEHLRSAANPTLLNGQSVERKLLSAGDRIAIGRVVLEVRAATPQDAKTEIVRRPPAVEATVVMKLGGEAWGHLAVLRGPHHLQGVRFPLSGEQVRIGRQPDCDVVLLDPDVSRVHAELSREGERVLLRHHSRTNPTARNGKPVTGEVELAHGDEIALAERVLMRFERVGAPHEEPTTPIGGLRKVMEARVDLEARLERDFVRDGSFLDVDVADSYGLKASEPRAERVFVSFERFRGYVAERVQEHAGRILNSNGDEVMAFFESADAAVNCARALLAALPVWNARENLLQRDFRVRIGIHTGRSAVDLQSGVAYSPVLDVAGHLQKTAPIGGVLISAATRAALAGEPADFEPGAVLARENMATWVLAAVKPP